MEGNCPLYNIFDPIDENRIFQSSFIRKKKTKNGPTKYYLYSEDQQDLMLVATIDTTCCFIITQDALNISRKSEYFVGEIVGNRSELTYKGIDLKGKEQISITFMNNKDKKGNLFFKHVKVQIPGDYEILQRQPSYVNGVYVLNFTETVIPSKKNFILDYHCDSCFSLGKLYEDEHLFIVKNPFSIFQGFCIAIASMKEFSKKT